MNQKKSLFLILLSLMLLAMPFASLAEIATPVTLNGLISEVHEGFFLLEDEAIGTVRVNLDDALTVYEGIAAKGKLAVGQYVFVTYNGIMSRSIPPQVSALKIGCYLLQGTVTDILENGFVVEGDVVLGAVVVHMGEGFPTVYQGASIAVYYNGTMTLSLPPQIAAYHIVVPMVEGTVSQATRGGFTLTDAQGTAFAITLDEHTVTYAAPKDGDQVRVYFLGNLNAADPIAALEVAAVGDDMTAQ